MLNFLYYKSLARAFKRAKTNADRWLIWCFTAGLIGWNFAMMTVAAIAPSRNASLHV